MQYQDPGMSGSWKCTDSVVATCAGNRLTDSAGLIQPMRTALDQIPELDVIGSIGGEISSFMEVAM